MAKLVVQDEDRTYLVDLSAGESILLGRSRECDLPLAASRASRRHAQILAGAGGSHELRDLGSTNGTVLNGAPLGAPQRLHDGDVIDLGGARLVYRSRP